MQKMQDSLFCAKDTGIAISLQKIQGLPNMCRRCKNCQICAKYSGIAKSVLNIQGFQMYAKWQSKKATATEDNLSFWQFLQMSSFNGSFFPRLYTSPILLGTTMCGPDSLVGAILEIVAVSSPQEAEQT
jgi:hypothetical protein